MLYVFYHQFRSFLSFLSINASLFCVDIKLFEQNAARNNNNNNNAPLSKGEAKKKKKKKKMPKRPVRVLGRRRPRGTGMGEIERSDRSLWTRRDASVWRDDGSTDGAERGDDVRGVRDGERAQMMEGLTCSSSGRG